MNERKSRQDKRDAVQAQASLWDERLRIKRRTLRDLAEAVGSNNVYVVALKQQFQAAQLKDEEAQLIQLDRDLRRLRLEAISEDAKVRSTPPADETAVRRLSAEDPDLKRLETLILEQKEKIWLATNEDAATLKATQDRLRNLQTAREQRIQMKRPEIEKEAVREMRARREEKVNALRGQVNLLEALQKDLQDDVARMRKEIHGAQAGTVSLENAKEENDSTEEISKKLHELLAQMEVEASAPARVSIWDKADFRVAQPTWQRVLIACGGGLAAMLCVIGLQIGYRSLGTRK
jgi:hypothetical protein